MRQVEVTYNDAIVRKFVHATILWGIVGMLVGVWIAILMAFPELNSIGEYFTFGRLRPLHTNAVIFAFVGNMLFAGVYYSTQRLLKVRMASDKLSNIHFWGWQLIIVAAALSLPLGLTQGKEYAELEWPIDLAVTLIWVVFAINFFWTLIKRNEKHLYVAIWFYIATIVTVAVLYIVNNMALPLMSGVKSYSVYSGVQDALVQWWYGHNAVAFFLTTPILGIMYYFLPKAADRPVYSYRLSIVHFWSLVFLYIWAGPHHLLYTALPDWAQSLGMIFSLMLWAPSWGGMLNGLLTLRGAWHKLRTDPVIKFLIAGVTFYGMATFEGPLLSIKAVSGLGHYTDWIIGHVHTGALGWNGFMAAGMLYWLVPKLWGVKLHSVSAANLHFWLGTVGILLYAVSMWVAGITEGLMWRAMAEDGGLAYPSFVQSTEAVMAMYITRIVGGTLYLVGHIIMAWNLWVTVKKGKPVDVTVTVTALEKKPEEPVGNIIWSKPMIAVYVGLVLMTVFFTADIQIALFAAVLLFVLFILTLFFFGDKKQDEGLHRKLEGRPILFTVLVLLAILIGGIAELVPTLTIDKAVPKTGQLARPYSPLELHGRDIYVKEGCYTCHSQMVRPFVSETLRYRGGPSRIEDSVWDHPFQWGSKRTGPDLAHIGIRVPDAAWHYGHLKDPRGDEAGVEGSVMPAYPHMIENKIDMEDTVLKLTAMKRLGVPYTKEQLTHGQKLAELQAKEIVAELAKANVDPLPAWDSEIVAIIAYLKSLGTLTQPVQTKTGGSVAKGGVAP